MTNNPGILDVLSKQMTAEALQEATLRSKKRRKEAQWSMYENDPAGFGEKVLGDTYTDPIRQVMQSVVNNQITIARSCNASGKSQPIDTPVLTPDGWREIGSIIPGDLVATQDGTFTEVAAVYPQGLQPTYLVQLNDGTETLASADHLWVVRSSGRQSQGLAWQVKTTEEIIPFLHAHIHIPMCNPVQHPHRDLPVDPYIVGFLLGDGSLSDRHSVRFDTDDPEVVTWIQDALSDEYSVKWYRKTHYGITDEKYRANRFRDKLEDLGMMGKKAHNKFIPEMYAFASVEQRAHLLAGLMDSDGTISKKHSMSFTSISIELARGVQALVQSLGGTGKISSRIPTFTHNGEKRNGQRAYRVRITLPFNPFRLERKGCRYVEQETQQRRSHRLIEAIEYVGEIESVCIKVDDVSSLYLTNDYIVTHNTHMSARVAIWFYLTYPDAQVYTTAAPPVDNLKRLMWGEIMSIVFAKPRLFRGHKVTTLNIERGPQSYLTGVAIPMTGSEAEREAKFSGKHAPHMLFIVDEGDAVPDEVYRGIEACMSGGHTRLLVMFNPRDKIGPVHRMERDGRGKVLHLSAFEHPNVISGRDIIPGAVDRETTIRRINEWTREAAPQERITDEFFSVPSYLVGVQAQASNGKLFRPLPATKRKVVQQEFWYMVLGKYPAQSEHQLIADEWVDQARQRWDLFVAQHGERPPGTTIMGVDIAELGADYNAACFRTGGFVAPFVIWSGLDIAQTVEKCLGLYKERAVKRALIDGDGVGAGVAPMVRRDGGKDTISIGVKVSKKALPFMKSEMGEFVYLRDQLWWAVREWLRADPGAMLPPDPMLTEELLTARYAVPNGKITIMKKDDMRKILKRSPDRADALLMTFAPQREARVRRLDG